MHWERRPAEANAVLDGTLAAALGLHLAGQPEGSAEWWRVGRRARTFSKAAEAHRSHSVGAVLGIRTRSAVLGIRQAHAIDTAKRTERKKLFEGGLEGGAEGGFVGGVRLDEAEEGAVGREREVGWQHHELARLLVLVPEAGTRTRAGCGAIEGDR